MSRLATYRRCPRLLEVMPVGCQLSNSLAQTETTTMLESLEWRDAAILLEVVQYQFFLRHIVVLDKSLSYNGLPCLSHSSRNTETGVSPPMGWRRKKSI